MDFYQFQILRLAKTAVTTPAKKLVRAATAGFALGLCVIANSSFAQTATGPESSMRDAAFDPKAFVRAAPVPAWVKPVNTPKPTLEKTANTPAAAILLADSQLHLVTEPQWYVQRVIQINEASALNQVGTFAIEFVPDYQKVQLHTITVTRDGVKSDRLASANIRFLQRERGLEQGMYSGVITASIILTDIRVGDQVAYQYTTTGDNPVFEGKFATSTSWAVEAPLNKRYVSMLFKSDRPLKYRWAGDSSPFDLAPVVTREGVSGELTRWVFEGDNIPAATPEGYNPVGYLPFRFLQLSEFNQWSDVAQWANRLFAGAQSTVATKALAARFANLPTAEDKVRAALNYVQKDIRYFSVSLGESSHRPALPDLVANRRFGDCKDKTQLLVAILRDLGITAQPALISVSYTRRINEWQPTPLAFDHVIARVEIDGKVYFVDPTRLPQSGQLALMGQGLIRHQAFVIDGKQGRFEDISSPIGTLLAANELNEFATLKKFSDAATLQAQQILRGNGADALRATIARGDRAQLKQWLEAEVTQRYAGASMQGDFVVKDDPERNEIEITSTFVVPNFAVADRQNWFVRVSAANARGIVSLPQNRNRTTPFGSFVFPLFVAYSLQIQFPENVAAIFDPSLVEFKNKHFEFTGERTFRGNRASVVMRFKTLTDTVEAKEFTKFVDDLDKAMRGMPSVVFVESTIIQNTGLLARRKTLEEQLTDRYQEEVALLSKAMDGGKLNDTDIIEAHRERAGALVLLGQYEKAKLDIETVIKAKPTDSAALTVRANITSQLGDQKKAIEDYNRAIRLGAEGEAYYRRGIALYFLGNYDGAAQDFAKSAIDRKGADGLYPRLWQIWSLRRANKPLPADLAQAGVGIKPDQWPLSAYTVAQRGDADTAPIFASIETLKGEEKQLALSEGYFYAGQELLINGQIDKARAMFEQCIKVGAIHYIEHGAAALELARMNNK